MVIFRLLQGIAGAPLIPLSQGVLVGLFPADQRSKGMAIWGIGVMLGPILGPTVGGIGSLQTLLDRGNQEGWWNSDFILRGGAAL